MTNKYIKSNDGHGNEELYIPESLQCERCNNEAIEDNLCEECHDYIIGDKYDRDRSRILEYEI